MALEIVPAVNSSVRAAMMSAARFTKTFFYTFLDVRGILLGYS
jgi:hypothetical protein